MGFPFFHSFLYLDYDSGAGEVAEWFKATVLKTVVGLYPTVGSNPTLSAIIK